MSIVLLKSAREGGVYKDNKPLDICLDGFATLEM